MNSKSSKVKTISRYIEKHSQGNRWVIGDVHGCAKTFASLLLRIEAKEEDQIFLLGDLINKGPSSAEVLNTVSRMINTGHHIYIVMGNHELNLIKHKENPKHPTAFLAEDLLNWLKVPKKKYIKLLSDLPYYYELPGHFLVHAGFDLKDEEELHYDKEFERYEEMTRLKNKKKKWQGKTIIHGHRPKDLDKIIAAIEKRKTIIPLDNGCTQKDKPQRGHLIALNLDTYEYVVQRNIE